MVGVVLAAVAFFAVGALWYGVLFSRQWMRLTGVTESQARQSNLPLIYGVSAVLGLVAAIGLAAIIGAASAGSGLGVGALVVAPVLAVQVLYDRRPLTLWALNAGYYVLGFAAMGLILGALQ